MITFLADNYIWFLVISILLIFALIGYLVEEKQDERFAKKINLDEEILSKLENSDVSNVTMNEFVEKSTTQENKENNKK